MGIPLRQIWARRWVRRTVRAAVAAALLPALLVLGCVGWVRADAAGHLYREDTVPSAPVAIVFGAQIYSPDHPSPYLQARLNIAQRLYAAHKVKAILVSGDNGHHSYDEPTTMRDYLVAHGVPARKIVADYAGFTTYDTCARARRIFGITHAIAVSQDFHVPRATALCASAGIHTDAVGDTHMHNTDPYASNWLRDQLADTKAVWNIVTQPDPKYLGRHESGVTDAIRS